MKVIYVAFLMLLGLTIKAQEYKPVDGDEVLAANYLTNRSADSVVNHLAKYLDRYGEFVLVGDKKTGNVKNLEFVTRNQNDPARSTKLKVNILVRDGKAAELEINGYIGHIVNLFRGYWQTDFDTIFNKEQTLFRKYGTDYIMIRNYSGANFARILITDKPRELKSVK